MVWSMTGYGRDVRSLGQMNITVEIRTVNHRFLDISAKIPRTFLFLEERMKKVAKSFFRRGRVEIFLKVEGEGLVKQNLRVNWGLMDQYINSLEKIKTRYHMEGNIPLESAIGLESLFTVEEQEQEQTELSEAVIAGVTAACQQVEVMRKQEGLELAGDLKNRLIIMEAITKELGERRDIVIMEYRERILERIQNYVDEPIGKDSSRMYQEIALLAEKGDITEEVTRLDSHIQQFFNTLISTDAVGRKLDFISQEMLREANTIGSKSTDVHISEKVVAIKSEIEKIKEQVQNIE